MFSTTADPVVLLLDVPFEGWGRETTVFRRPSSDDLERFANTGNYGYRAEAADGCPRQVIASRLGELVLFSSRNLHCVSPSSGAGSRIAAGSFIGRMPSDGLVLWS